MTGPPIFELCVDLNRRLSNVEQACNLYSNSPAVHIEARSRGGHRLVGPACDLCDTTTGHFAPVIVLGLDCPVGWRANALRFSARLNFISCHRNLTLVELIPVE